MLQIYVVLGLIEINISILFVLKLRFLMVIIILIVFIYTYNAVISAVSKCNARCLFFEGGYYNCKIITKGVKTPPIINV